jgi:hypothetical protein
MTKPVVVRLFVGSIIAVIAGLVLGFAAVWAAFAGGVFQLEGPDVVGFNPSGFAWAMVGLTVLGVLAIIGGGIAGLVAWIGALLNTSRLEDKTWFVLLLVLGVLSFGFVAMLAYVIAGPDGTAEPAPPVHAMRTGGVGA